MAFCFYCTSVPAPPAMTSSRPVSGNCWITSPPKGISSSVWTNCFDRNSLCHLPSAIFHLPAILFADSLFLPLSPPCDQIFIHANQLGYPPGPPKIALPFSKTELPRYFSLLSVDNQQIVHEARPRSITNVSWGHFDRYAELDFSSFKTP